MCLSKHHLFDGKLLTRQPSVQHFSFGIWRGSLPFTVRPPLGLRDI